MVLFLDRNGLVLEANHGARLLLGEAPDLATIFPELSDEECAHALGEAAERGVFPLETWALRHDGRRFRADAVLSPLDNGELLLVLRDISRRRSEQEREARRLQQSATVNAFAQRATHEVTPEAIAEAAVEHIATAVMADYMEILELHGERLETAYAFGWGPGSRPEGNVDVAAPTIYGEAMAGRDTVARELRESDLEHAPHLRTLGMRYGIAVAKRLGDHVCVAAAFARSPIPAEDLHPFQSITAMCEAVYARRLAERQLAERDHTVSMILDQLPAVLTTFDRDLRVTTVQGAGLRDVGHADFLRAVRDGPGDPAAQAFEAALRGESGSFSATWRGRYYENRVEPLRNAAGDIVGAMNLGLDLTERVANEQALAASREELRRLSARLNQLQEEERRRIAHELHDELGQRLTALRMEASLLPRKMGKRAARAATDAVAAMLELIDETIVTVRRVATELRPPILDDFGFRAVLELELSALQKRSGIDYEIHFAPDDLHVDREHATTLYRIVQESLTNVARHAGATYVRVSLERRNGDFVLRIEDDGRGITEEERTSSGSLGLLGIRERAYAHGGEARIGARERGGTLVEVRLPAGGER